MTAGLILALMIMPIITSLTREVLRHRAAGPDKDAALRLGATRWEMISGVGASRTAAAAWSAR